MYIVVITVILVLIAIILLCGVYCSAENETLSLGSTIDVDHDQLMELFHEKAEYIKEPIVQSVDEENVYREALGLYNMSVRKTAEGFSGIIRGSSWNGCFTHNTTPVFSNAYYINIDDNGSVLDLHLLDLDYQSFTNCRKYVSNVYANGIEDPRIFMFQGEDWVIANCLGSPQQQYPCVNNMCIFKVDNPKETFKLLSTPPGVDPKQQQKNWSPFEYNGELYCEYQLEPHTILKVDPKTGKTTEGYITGQAASIITSETSLRGSTPPILINNTSDNSFPGKFYLGVGHTRTILTSDYLHFFYIFEAEPPFKMIKVSSHFKLHGKERIQFAAGLSQYEDKIYISYGVNDCSNRISYFTIDDMLSMMTEN